MAKITFNTKLDKLFALSFELKKIMSDIEKRAALLEKSSLDSSDGRAGDSKSQGREFETFPVSQLKGYNYERKITFKRRLS